MRSAQQAADAKTAAEAAAAQAHQQVVLLQAELEMVTSRKVLVWWLL